jgi:hypothetical protein
MVINYPFYFLLLHLLRHFHYFLGNEICLEKVLQPFTIYVLFRIVMRSLPPSRSFAEFQHAFLFRKRFVGNTFGTPVRPPRSLARDWGLWVTKNTFLWVLSTHKNFTKDWRMLEKSLQIIWESCRWLDLHPLYSLLFHEIMDKYEAEPPPNDHLFYILTSLSNWE